MITIECSAFFAAMNENALTVSDPRTRRRPRLFSRSRAPQSPPAARGEDGAAPRARPWSGQRLAVIDVELPSPVAQRLRRASQLTRELRDRAAAGPEQPDCFSAELR